MFRSTLFSGLFAPLFLPLRIVHIHASAKTRLRYSKIYCVKFNSFFFVPGRETNFLITFAKIWIKFQFCYLPDPSPVHLMYANASSIRFYKQAAWKVVWDCMSILRLKLPLSFPFRAWIFLNINSMVLRSVNITWSSMNCWSENTKRMRERFFTRNSRPVRNKNFRPSSNSFSFWLSGIFRGAVLLFPQHGGAERAETSFRAMEHRAKSRHWPEILQQLVAPLENGEHKVLHVCLDGDYFQISRSD